MLEAGGNRAIIYRFGEIDPESVYGMQRKLFYEQADQADHLIFSYTHTRPFIALGNSQSYEDLIDEKDLKEHLKGSDYVITRRLSGGGASFHEEEATVCFMEILSVPEYSYELMETYGIEMVKFLNKVYGTERFYLVRKTYIECPESGSSLFISDERKRFLGSFAMRVMKSSKRNDRVMLQASIRVRKLRDIETPVMAMRGYNGHDVEKFAEITTCLEDMNLNLDMKKMAEKFYEFFAGNNGIIEERKLIGNFGKCNPLRGGINHYGLCEMRRDFTGRRNFEDYRIEVIFPDVEDNSC